MCVCVYTQKGFPGYSEVKNQPVNAGDAGLIPTTTTTKTTIIYVYHICYIIRVCICYIMYICYTYICVCVSCSAMSNSL